MLSRIGKGTFGDVYHARMTVDGETRDVALKVARDVPAPSALARFRDEARILGFVDDPAIVSALPPVQLDGRWVMVMDLVDGASVAQVVKKFVFPPRAAVELVAEVARALDVAHSARGPRGAPLDLVHRDLKPANLMLTEDGRVKLLDFGIARAEFDEREAETAGTFIGTPGYIAPERLRGDDGPTVDIFSLGVVLHVLVTGKPATKISDRDRLEVESDVASVIAYASELQANVPSFRPTAKEIVRECTAFASWLGGPDLRSHAAVAVPKVKTRGDGELVGKVLVERLAGEAARPRLASGFVAQSTRLAVGRVLLGGFLVGLVSLTLAGALLGIPQLVALDTDKGLQPTATVQPTLREVVPPEPVAPEPTVVPILPKSRLRPEPAEAEPVARAPERSVPEPLQIVITTFLSEPAGAEVQIDGVAIGNTPLRGHPLSSGNHVLSFQLGEHRAEQSVRVGGPNGFREFSWTDEGIIVQ